MNFFAHYVGKTASQRLFLLLLFIQSALDVGLGLIVYLHDVPADQRSHMRSMIVANSVLGLCFIAIFMKTNARKSALQLWGIVGVLVAFAAWEPVAPVLSVLYTNDPHTKEPYSAVARLLATIKLSYRSVFVVLYIITAVFVHRSYRQFHQVVRGYLGKPSVSIKHAWDLRFKFVSLLGVHAIQVIVCVVSMFYMLMPHVDIGHASIVVVVAVKAVVMVSAFLGMMASTRESKVLMYGCLLSLLSELVFFGYLVVTNVITNYSLLFNNTLAAYVMIYGALSSMLLSILSILISIVYALHTMKTFGIGLREWVRKEYDNAVAQASTNPFKE